MLPRGVRMLLCMCALNNVTATEKQFLFQGLNGVHVELKHFIVMQPGATCSATSSKQQ